VRTVIFHHGTPSTALPHRWWTEDAERRGIRLVGYQRPGYGDASRAAGRDVDSVAQGVAALADELDVERFATWGISGGAPHALACAALLPDRVVAAAAVGGPAPYDAEGLDWFAGQGTGNVEEHTAAAEGEDVLRPLLEREAMALLAGGDGGFETLLSPPDRAVLPELQDFFGQTFREATETGINGWLDDDLAFTRPWGFDVSEIRVPVLLLHGLQDGFVPPDHARWLVSRIPGIEARLFEDEGHLSLYARIPEVHEWLLARF
jgi:pimeloyl-ACP methyl ester carboxylesterase